MTDDEMEAFLADAEADDRARNVRAMAIHGGMRMSCGSADGTRWRALLRELLAESVAAWRGAACILALTLAVAACSSDQLVDERRLTDELLECPAECAECLAGSGACEPPSAWWSWAKPDDVAPACRRVCTADALAWWARQFQGVRGGGR